MKKYNKIIILTLICTLLLSNTLVFASTKPIETKSVNIENIKDYNPIGTLTEDQIKNLRETENKANPMLIGPFPHDNLTITRIWSGYNWRGWIVSGDPGGTVSLSRSFGISNGANASVGVTKSKISATVGFNVTFTSSMTASYSHNTSAGMVGFIGLDDRYDNTCKDFDIVRIWTWDAAGTVPTGQVDYGTGSAWQWTRFAYYFGETSSQNILPSDPH